MEKGKRNINCYNKIFEVCFISFMYLISAIIYYYNNIIAGMLLIFTAVFIFVINYKQNKTIADIYLLFWSSWLGTLGLAMLRLLRYQQQWKVEFFLITYIGLMSMIIGTFIGKSFKLRNKIIKNNFKLSYYTVIFGTAIAILMSILSYLRTGIIPILSDKLTAYHDHYTRFYVIQVGMMPLGGIAYYVLRSFNLKRHQKLIMYLAMFIHLFVFPIIYVARGTFVICIFYVLPILYYYTKNKKRFLRIGVVVFLILLLVITSSRNYSNEQVEFFFQPKEVSILNFNFKLSNNLVMVYSYLTISHDNFNYNIDRIDSFSYGGRMLEPFEVILRTDFFNKLRLDNKLENISFGLNTHNMMGIIYYDFGILGIIAVLFIYGFIFGIIEKTFRYSINPYISLIYGGVLIVVSLGFFTAWTTQFTLWMWWGLSCILWKISPKQRNV
ncbi:O-antigen polymerase [Acetivibrio clariflavus]|uniref:O-antigen polymerase n=1 Tax=Acetivibrio clariflavus TaxID=288965 RepID=UPI000488797E|nr:O-antigen polymerase [Acetivibrio clariflavus]